MQKTTLSLSLSLGIFLALLAFSLSVLAHDNRSKANHPVGLDTESCQGALAGTADQLVNRGKVNPKLLANVEDKCGLTECRVVPGTAAQPPQLVCGNTTCNLVFDAANEPTLVCEQSPVCTSDDDCRTGLGCPVDTDVWSCSTGSLRGTGCLCGTEVSPPTL